ncbi:RNA-binding cell elongation regulator Jag/EloR [Miniphocaeibacter massiliensis]|uniref:RNA-binding cell elongation regulator Jag/EloR n=1 Tax=Miniphocaeibacter massiliensis TaxID=2041841 RepID=UPI000C1C105C|nr:RNA-binding cell elongation regulator Jag/EloR [Miniphocaeibacter massiliensis]
MKSTVKIAKTVEQAVSAALKELNCSREEAIVEILEKPKSGLFGLIGSKDAVVKVSCEENIEELLNDVVDTKIEEKEEILDDIEETDKDKVIVEEIIEKEETENLTKKESVSKEEIELKTKQFLNNIVTKMGIEVNIETFHEDNFIKFNIIPVNQDDIGIIIGKRGETLDAIQYIINLVANRNSEEYLRISVDSNGYREKRIKSLESLAKKMAGKAKKYNRNMKLEPMNPYERRIIHSALQGISGITTASEGDEPYRRVIIKVKRKNK